MRLPRDLSGKDLIKCLSRFGYQVTRQSGSHVRLTTLQNGEHHITVPNHDTIKIGTLSSIVGDVAIHFNKTKEEIANELF